MPAIPSIASILESSLVHRDVLTLPLNSTIASRQALEVICAWPVSGQYGPGTRALYIVSQFNRKSRKERTNRYARYYILLAACVVARKVDWIRNACLAAVLLFPAVAALHAVVLALLHVEGVFTRVNSQLRLGIPGQFDCPERRLALTTPQVPLTWMSTEHFNYVQSVFLPYRRPGSCLRPTSTPQVGILYSSGHFCYLRGS